jgi:uncharacterized paraquat-inducible protein A
MLLVRLKTFVKSLFFHIYAGFPKATQAEIIDRWIECQKCKEFNSEKSECNICGCSLSVKSKFLNKLAWADQECPIGKWSKIKRETNNENKNT